MSIPYFARRKRVRDRKIEEGPILLFLPDVQELIGHLLSKPLSDIPSSNLAGIVSGYYFAQSHIVIVDEETRDFVKGEVVWKEIIECIFELANIVIPLVDADELYDLYVTIMDGITEAQQDLFHAEQQIKALKEQDADVEVQFKAQIEKYLILYEGLVKKTISFAVKCLDIITGHKDVNKKDAAAYVNDDLSYKQGKVEEASGIQLATQVRSLLTGVNKHIRNSISHKRFEYTDEGHVTFRDVRKGEVIYERTFHLSTFELRTRELEVNFLAQAAALILFVFEMSDKFKVKPARSTKPKAVKSAVYTACIEALLAPMDIHLVSGLVMCKVQRDGSLDYPSELVASQQGVRIRTTQAPVPLRHQLINVAVYLAEYGIPVSVIELTAVDYAGEHLGRMRIDVGSLADAMKGPPFPPIETFILESDLENKDDSRDYSQRGG